MGELIMVKYIVIFVLILYLLFLLFRTSRYENNLKMFGFNFFKYTLKPIFKLWYPYKVINKPKDILDDGVIYCGNHIHLMDQCLAILSTKRPIHYMAKIEYFKSYKTKWFFKLAGCIPVDRKNKDENAKSIALDVLSKKEALGIFPEGTRNKTDKLLQEFKFGAVSMAKKTDAWLIPFAITGDYKWRTKNLRIEYGKPFKVGNMSLEEANQKLYNDIYKIIKKNRD